MYSPNPYPRGPALDSCPAARRSSFANSPQAAKGPALNSAGAWRVSSRLPAEKSSRAQLPSMPPGANAQLWDLFLSVSKESYGAITSTELQKVLYKSEGTEFNFESIYFLMSKFDVNHTGKLTFDEYCHVCDYIAEWRTVFRHFDTDRNGLIDCTELQDALRCYNCDLQPRTVAMVAQEFTTLPSSVSNQRPESGSAGFVGFMMACVTVKALTERYHKKSSSDPVLHPFKGNSARMNYDQYIQVFLKNREDTPLHLSLFHAGLARSRSSLQ